MDKMIFDESLPLYFQVYNYLKSSIQNGTFENGQQIPSERELTELFDVNRSTIRRAIEKLIGEGLIIPIRRKGYYANTRDFTISINKKTSYTQSMVDQNLKPKVEILEIKTIEPDNEQRELFSLHNGDKLWSLYFLRFYKQIPFALSRCYFNYDRMPDLNLHLKTDHSLYSILNKQYGIFTTRVSSECEACMADKKESKYLSVLGAAPLLMVTSRAVDQKGVFVEESITKFRADLVKIKVDLNSI